MHATTLQNSKPELKRVEREVSRAVAMVKRGFHKEKVVKRLRGGRGLRPELIYEVARCRLHAREKFGPLAEKLFFDEEGLRYATPAVVAEYRAERLKCDVIADVSCGAGAQLVFFAMRCRKAYGVELNEERAKLAALNVASLGLENVEIIVGDATGDAAVKRLKDAEVVFSDPSRPPGEEVRTIESLQPPPLKIVEKYQRITEKLAFELPPQMPPERVRRWLAGEKEYTSLNFQLNRLALYMGELAECDVSAISLPSGERVTSEDAAAELEAADAPKAFLYEVDPTVVKATLLRNLLGKLGLEASVLSEDKRRTLLTSDEEASSAFLRRYRVLELVNFGVASIKEALKRLDARKVTLRFSLPPSEYWSVRKRLEEGLSGERWIHLFKIKDKALLAERLSPEDQL
ncbi:MAG: tRNA/tmRNA/rRNA uracil-C5-methylase [Candidatus Alkanophagales archaeon MCA70_species_1]|nr:tRNA/tmRNA/rRNA uracil-C5-methylase [Candidatus Alkanophaga volatiphilum]